MTLTFVVGTGRCGSTMLSRILREHPDVLSVSEFVATLQAATGRAGFPTGELDGREFWRILAAPAPFLDILVRDGLRSPEMCYPYGRGRFDVANGGVPLICHFTLPMLAGDPDVLFDRLAGEVPAWPRRPAAAQYRALFAHLAGLFGRRVVVERSGGSLAVTGLLHEQFPDARFVHMYRAGPDCALSMSRYPVMRVLAIAEAAARAAGLSPATPPAEIAAAAPDRFAGMVVPPFDAERVMSYSVPPARFGRWWSEMVEEGVAELAKLPSTAWASLRYEDLLDGGADERLRWLAGFIGVPATSEWLAAARRLIDPSRSGAAARLDPETHAELREACEPGARAIAAVTPGGDHG